MYNLLSILANNSHYAMALDFVFILDLHTTKAKGCSGLETAIISLSHAPEKE
jgi:hypothetical protein